MSISESGGETDASAGHGSIEVVTGSMFSGKTEEVLRRLRRARIARQQVQVFKPKLDVRFGRDKVKSHSGAEFQAAAVEASAEILDCVNADTTVVAIDEAQFFDPDLTEICDRLAQRGVRVIVAGLDQDFRGEPFGPMPLLLAQAEHVHKLHAICMVCGQAASRTQRMIDGRPAFYEEPIVLVGGSDSYEARCRVHHEVPHQAEIQAEN
ncbi:MAG: thymidine kinase [Anaerolineales bacterium]|jgi:thymidine kinase|nr:thymidine kinase [Anaerolineales bacterium]MDP7345817.1 thymidine kinase [Anaerolineales bacterium]MDP7643962.1 thymidine kinase [Anaerolineales bacterium]HJN42032.1 thymidine kinase [Anaerolineales bacterium]